MALNELSITVCRSDGSQAWGSESTLMKFVAGKGRESRRKEEKHRDNGASPTFCFCEAHKPGQCSPEGAL